MRDPRMEAFVQQVRAGTDILAVVQGYVPLKRKGGRYWGCCPFHNEKTASFSVVPADGFFYCFGCHAGGDAFKFISLMEHITPFEAIVRQAEQLGIPLPERKRDAREEARLRALEDLRRVNALARDFFHNCLTVTRYGAAGKAYLAGRGITDAAIARYQLGFAPDAWAKLSDAFKKRGISEQLLVDAGLAMRRERGGGIYDRFRGRVIIPIADERGRIVGFGGRALGDAQPKYLNTAETPVFNKRRLLFGLDRAHRAIAHEGCAVVVEGYMDAIAAWEAGAENVVATLGTSFTEEHAALLLRRAPRIVFCYDSDAAGQEATLRALAAVRGRAAEVRVLLLPDGKDPDEYVRTHGAAAFRGLIETAVPAPAFRLRHVWRTASTDSALRSPRCCPCSQSWTRWRAPHTSDRRQRSSFSMRALLQMRCGSSCGRAGRSPPLHWPHSAPLCAVRTAPYAVPDASSSRQSGAMPLFSPKFYL